MSTDTLTRPDVQLHTGQDPDEVAHIVDQRPCSGQDIATAYIEGSELVALCGHRWVPSRDPQRLPLCEACRVALEERFTQ